MKQVTLELSDEDFKFLEQLSQVLKTTPNELLTQLIQVMLLSSAKVIKDFHEGKFIV